MSIAAIGAFLFNNLEYVVAIGGVASIPIAIRIKSYKNNNKNDLTQMMVKLNRQKERLNKQSKGLFS